MFPETEKNFSAPLTENCIYAIIQLRKPYYLNDTVVQRGNPHD